MTTNAECASVLYWSPQDTTEDDNELLQIIDQWLLTSYVHDNSIYSDNRCSVIFNKETFIDHRENGGKTHMICKDDGIVSRIDSCFMLVFFFVCCSSYMLLLQVPPSGFEPRTTLLLT